FIGVPLKKIFVLQRASAADFVAAMRAQRKTLEGRKRLIDQAIGAILEAEMGLRSGKPADATLLTRIIEIVETRNSHTQESETITLVQTRMDRLRSLSPEARTELKRQWSVFLKDMREARSEDP